MTRAPSDAAFIHPQEDGAWSRCEELIEAFELAWQAGPPPRIEDYLHTAGAERDALLVELVHVDLEFRIKVGESARVETYLSRFPELARDNATVLDLLDAEHEQRRRKEADLTLDEYSRRFPTHAEDLRNRTLRISSRSGAVQAPPTHRIQPPSVAEYEILNEIGRGGMGVIYKALQSRLKRHVALKFLPDDVIRDRALLDRFVREAVTASALNHPNICTVHELGEHEGRPFIVMEFIAGQTLAAVAALRPPVAEACRLMRQAARALAAAHAAGVVHRDIKPENVMVRDDGYVKVLDFGLARRLPKLNQHETRGSNDTSAGAVLGTVAYMSPEQARGDVLDGSSDVFSLGVVFYELVTGRHPFESESAFSTLHAISSCRPVLPSRTNADVSPSLSGLIEAMLNKDPRLRPSAAAVEQALDRMAHRQEGGRPTVALRPIVHRQPELVALRAALSAVEVGSGRVICITGEPGIGKTTLVEDFLGELTAPDRACVVARGRCSERQAGTEAFLPVLDALRDLLASDSSGSVSRLMKILAPTWHDQLQRSQPASPAAEPSRAASQHAMLREFCALLGEISRLGPVVLFFDDVHWADLSTVDLLAHFGRHRQSLRVLVIVTFRPTEMLLGPHPFHPVRLDLQAQGACSEIAVGFLGREGIDNYLALVFPKHAFEPEFADLVYSRTEGSPLFMADLLGYLREQGVISEVNGRWSLAGKLPDLRRDLPQSVRSMIERKFGQLGSEDRHLLEAAAVQGYEFDTATLSAALFAGAAAVEDRLQRLERVHGVVRLLGEVEFPDRTLTQRYVFVHVLYQQVLAAEIAPTRRATLSVGLAQALERHYGAKTTAAAEIACLYEAGRENAKAASYFHLAAQNAGQVFAHRAAIALAQRGLKLLDSVPMSPDRDKLELALQMALGLQFQLTEGYASDPAKQAYDRARDLCQSAGASKTLFPILWGLWLHYKVRSQLPRAQELANELFAQARTVNNPDLALQAHQALGMTALCRGEQGTCLRHVEQVASIYNPTRHGEHAAMFGQDPSVMCKSFGAIALWLLGFPDAARRQCEAAIDLSRKHSPTTQSIALHFAAMLCQLCRDARQTRLYAEASAEISAEHGLSFWLAGGGVLTGWAMVATGDSEGGINQLRKGLLDWQATGSTTYRTYYLALLAETLAREGKLTEGHGVLDEALLLVEQTDERFFEAELHRLRGELHLQGLGVPSWESAAPAEAAFRQAIEVSRRQDAKSLQLRAATSLARLQRLFGDDEESQACLAEAYKSITQGHDTPDLRDACDLLARQKQQS